MTEGTPEFSDDGFLGGRIVIRQPRKGYRAGLDAVFLAACVPCAAGETIFEAGMGVGTAALCVASRVQGVSVTGLELSPLYARLARENVMRNGMAERITVIEGDVTTVTRSRREECRPGRFDHAIANPPYHRAERSTASPRPEKAQAHAMGEGELALWIRAMAAMVRPRGTISIVQRPEHLPAILSAMTGRAGDIRIAPLFPRAGSPASLILVQGIKGSRADLRLLPGLMLHGEGNGFTEEAEAVLRHGAGFPLR